SPAPSQQAMGGSGGSSSSRGGRSWPASGRLGQALQLSDVLPSPEPPRGHFSSVMAQWAPRPPDSRRIHELARPKRLKRHKTWRMEGDPADLLHKVKSGGGSKKCSSRSHLTSETILTITVMINMRSILDRRTVELYSGTNPAVVRKVEFLLSSSPAGQAVMQEVVRSSPRDVPPPSRPLEEFVSSPTEEMNEDSFRGDLYWDRLRSLRPDCLGRHAVPLGKVYGILGAVQAQDALLSLLRSARGELFLYAYTLDRDEIVDRLIEAHRYNSVVVMVILDKKMTFEGKTKNMLAQAAKLASNGCLVRMASGIALDREYQNAGRRVHAGLSGVSHAKAVLTGNWFLCGSTNWTTPSRCNVEKNCVLELDDTARKQRKAAQADWEAAGPFTEDLRRGEESRRDGSGEAIRSRSEPAPPRIVFGDFE
ncbi:unnamed protein product, partial [Polarella glacialis]